MDSIDSNLYEVIRRNDTAQIERLLLSNKSLVNAEDHDGKISLHVAVLENKGSSHQEAIRILMNNNASIDAQDKQGNTALHYLADDKARYSGTILDLFFEFNAHIEIFNKQAETPLFKAIRYGNVEMAQLLVERGAKVNQRNLEEETPLHWACLTGNEKIIKILVDNGADVNAKDARGKAPLHVAGVENEGDSHQEAIRILLENGANVNAQDRHCNTALRFLAEAKTSCSSIILDLLMKFNANVDVENIVEETPLITTIRLGNVEMAQLLVERGANVKRHNTNDTLTPLHWACSHRNEKMIKFFMDNGADLNARTLSGRIPLVYYCLNIMATDKPNKKLHQFLIEFSDFTKNAFKISLNEFDYVMKEFSQKMILAQIAKLQALNIPVHPRFLYTVSKSYYETDHTEYLNKCKEELFMAKSSKLKNSWVSFFNLLVDNERKLKNYAGNEDLLEDFNQTDCLKKFPIYGSLIQENMNKAIETRKLFDESAEKLSDCWPIFNPTHLIIRDTLDCLNFEDYKIFV